MCSCQKISGMKKRNRKLGKSGINVDMEGLLYTAGGAVAALGLNVLLNRATENMSTESKKTLGKVVPFVKIAGGYLLADKAPSQTLAYMGVGVMAEGAIEAAIVAAPETFSIVPTIAGFGDMYTAIGNPYSYDALPGVGRMYESYDQYTEGDELIAGVTADNMVV